MKMSKRNKIVQEIDKLATLITQLKLGDEELLVRNYIGMAGEVCIKVEYSTNYLVNLAFEDGLIPSHDFNLNTNLDDVND